MTKQWCNLHKTRSIILARYSKKLQLAKWFSDRGTLRRITLMFNLFFKKTHVQTQPARGGLLGKLVKYIEFFYLYLFYGNSPRGQTRRRIFTLDGWLILRGLAQRCAFWGFRWYCSTFWGWNFPKIPIWIGFFKQNWRNIESFTLSKLLNRFQPNFI